MNFFLPFFYARGSLFLHKQSKVRLLDFFLSLLGLDSQDILNLNQIRIDVIRKHQPAVNRQDVLCSDHNLVCGSSLDS